MKTLANAKFMLLVVLMSLLGCSVQKDYNNCSVCGYGHTPGHTRMINEQVVGLRTGMHLQAYKSPKQWRLALQGNIGSFHRGESANFRRHLWYAILVSHAEKNICYKKADILLSLEDEENEDRSHIWDAKELAEYDKKIENFESTLWR